MPTMDGKANVLFAYLDHRIERREEPEPQTLTGPATAPGGDIAALALSYSANKMFHIMAFAGPFANAASCLRCRG
jgi:hypothetical protein